MTVVHRPQGIVPRGPGLLERWDVRPGALVVAAVALLLLGTRQSYTVPYTGLGLPPAQLILFVLVALWVLTRLVGQRAATGIGVLGAVVLVRLMFVTVSFGSGAGLVSTPDLLSASDRAVATEYVAAGGVVVLGLLLRRVRDIELVLRALVIGGALSGAAAALFYASGYDVAALAHLPGLRDTIPTQTPELMREGLVRARGTSAAPLELGAAMSILVPIAIGLAYAARRRGQHGVVWFAAAAIMTAGAVVSLSRSVFIGIGAALVLMMIGWPVRRTVRFVGVLVAAAVAAVLSGVQIVSAVSTVLFQGSDDYSLGSRADGRTYVFAHFTDHLWFGQGPGTYDLVNQPVLDNQYLSQLMETGVVGLVALAAVLVGAAVAAVAAARRLEGDGREIALGVAGAALALIVVSSVLDTAGFAQVYTVQWLLVGVCAALWRCASRRPDTVVTDAPAADAAR